jgi:hypothetical protein
MSFPRFNHVAMSLPAEQLDAAGRRALLDFHGEVFGWTEMPTLTRDRELLVLRCHSNEQFVFLCAGAPPMRAGEGDHFGVQVDTPEQLDALLARALQIRERDPAVEIRERKLEDYRVLRLHSFYVRYHLPLWIEVQCYEWAEGFGPDRTS